MLLKRLFSKSYKNFLTKRNFATTSRLATHHHKSLYCFSEDEKQLQESVSLFARTRVAPHVRAMEDKGVSKDLIQELFDHGLMGLEVESKYGGLESTLFSVIIAVEELAKVDMGVSLYVDLQNTLINNLISKLGTEEQKDKYLPQLCSNTIASFCLSEEQSGSDAFALKTTAMEDGDDYVINGSKMWISHALDASFFLVMANVAPDQGYKGITCFIVDKDIKGVDVGMKEDKMGLRSSNTCPVHFEDVRVSKKDVLGEVGKGYKYAIGMLNGGRIGIAAQLVGAAQGCMDHTIPYLLDRKQFKQSIFDFQGLNHQVAQIYTKIQAAKLLTYNAARLKDSSQPYIHAAAMAKYMASEVVTETTSKCIEWLGGVGFCKSMPVEKYYRDCKIGSIYEGTSNIQLNAIAKHVKQIYKMH